MTEKLEWLRYGALGVAGLALTTAAGLLTARVRGASQQWNTNVRLFMAFAVLLALVAAGTELLERIFPDLTSQQNLADLQSKLDAKTTDYGKLKEQYDSAIKERYKMKEKAEAAELQLQASTNSDALLSSIKAYISDLHKFSDAKYCLDNSLIKDNAAKNTIITMLDQMNEIIKELAKATGQNLSVSPLCRG